MENNSSETMKEDIVIVGAGIAGLSTALGLHRLGLKSLVLEGSDSLRVTGFALTLWTNAWRALDALGVADSLRQNYPPYARIQVASADSQLSQNMFQVSEDRGDCEGRCIRRKDLLETLEKELPTGTIRYSSKVVLIDDSRYHKLLHLTDGSTIQTKVLLGCDGVNSMVTKLLGLQRPVHSGRSCINGLAEFKDGYKFQRQSYAYFGGGVRFGFGPCYGNFIYWFCTYYSSAEEDKEIEEDPAKMKQFVLSKIRNVPGKAADIVQRIVEITELGSIWCSPLKFRVPWNLLTGNIARENMSVAGDALHPMTPDIAQGGCSALEDGVALARCVGEAFLNSPREENMSHDEEYERIRKGLKKYADGRRWRSFFLISTSYIMGAIQQSDCKVINFLQQKFLSKLMINTTLKMADYDCGELVVS